MRQPFLKTMTLHEKKKNSKVLCLEVFFANESKLDALLRREAVGGRPRLPPPLYVLMIARADQYFGKKYIGFYLILAANKNRHFYLNLKLKIIFLYRF